MNIKLSDWASIAEIVSGIAVVISLVFLIVGIRENTETTRAAAFDRNIDSINQVSITLAQDEELFGLYQHYSDEDQDIEDLSREEWVRVRMMVRTMLRIYETAYYSNQYGTLGSSEWGRFEHQICVHHARMDTPRWRRVSSVLTDEFVNYVQESCEDDL